MSQLAFLRPISIYQGHLRSINKLKFHLTYFDFQELRTETIYSSHPIRSPLAPYNDKTFATDGFIEDASSVGERVVKLSFLFTPFYLVPSGQNCY
jgi:hypothetical protein